MLLQLVLISLYAIASGQQAATDATFAGVYAGAQVQLWVLHISCLHHITGCVHL